MFLLGQFSFTEEVAYTPQSHVNPIKIVAQGEVGVGGAQTQVYLAVH